ncbi:MAG: GAF domain-containing protein [Candidatus Rokuibacteriota bacterium]
MPPRTKAQLLAEMEALRARIAELEGRAAGAPPDGRDTKEAPAPVETMLAVAQALALDLPTGEAMRRVTREVARAFQADMVGAYFLDARRGALLPVAGYHVPKHLLPMFLETPFSLRNLGILREAWQTREPVWMSDALNDPRWFGEDLPRGIGPHSVLFAPTAVHGDIVGGLFLVWWTAGRTFQPAELRLIQGVASQVGLALENAELAQRTQQKLQEAETLLTVSRALSSTLELQPLLRHFLRQVTHALGADTVAAWRVDTATGELLPFAAYHVPPDLVEPARRYRLNPKENPSYTEAILQKRVMASSNVPEDPRIPESLKAMAPHRSQLLVPIVARDRTIGAFIAIWWDRSREFSERELALVEAMATQAGTAVENARLYEVVETQWREVEVLAELARDINGSLDLDTILQRVADGAREVCRSDIAEIALRDPISDAMVFRYGVGALHAESIAARIEPGKGIGGLVLVTGRAARTDHYAEDPRITSDYLEAVRQEGIIATLAVPIQIGGRIEGLLHVDNRAHRPFTDRDEAGLLRLAEHAAIAIRNARLFEETEQRRRSAESLADLGPLLAQSLNPVEVGQRIVDSVRTLLGAEASALFRLEPASGDLVALAASGEVEPTWGQRLVVPHGTGLASVALRERRLVTTSDLLNDARVVHTPEGHARIEDSGYRAALAVPLLVKDEVIGALVVRDRMGRMFDDAEIRLARAFADQAVLALGNARLYEEARSARDFLQSITENSADAIVTTDVHGRITYFSPGAQEIFGFRSEEVLGRLVADYYVSGQEEARAVMQRLKAEGRIRNYETAMRGAGGGWIAVNTSISLLRDPSGAIVGTLGIIKDLTERRRTEEGLRESEERFRSAFEYSEIGMALQGVDGRYLRVNRALCEMVGYAESELLEMTWQSLTHPEDLDTEDSQRLRSWSNRAYQIEKRYLHKQGHPVWVLANVSLVRARDGAPLYFIAQIQDVSERKRAEEVRQELEAQLRQSQKMEAVGRLAGGVAHDFNNLLTVIRGRSDLLLLQLQPDAPLRRHVELLRQTADRAATLTQQLLAFSRKQMLQPKILDLNLVVAAIKKMLRRLIGEHIDLVLHLEPALGRVKADPGQLEQVILNLAVNARDAMLQGGRLTISTADVELDAMFVRQNPGAQPGSFVRLSVSDTGIGMDSGTQAHLFEPFFTTKGVGQGTGLGLATVYGIVKQSGGYIAVESTPGHGTTFTIYLPRVEGPEAPLGAETPASAVVRGWETVLLVEDEAQVRDLGREILEMHGYTVLEAPHGARALQLSQQHGGPIHLMVTDVVMPHMSGRDLAERLMPLRPEMKVLYVSGYTDDAIVHQSMLDPGTPFLQKPFTPEALGQRVRELLDQP